MLVVSVRHSVSFFHTYIYTSGGHCPMLAQVVYIAYTPLLLHIHHFATSISVYTRTVHVHERIPRDIPDIHCEQGAVCDTEC